MREMDFMKGETEDYVTAAMLRRNAVADRLAKAAGFSGELRPGNLVQLKSGSPPMAIAGVDLMNGMVHCVWNLRGRPFGARYPAEVLEPAERGAYELTPPPKKPGKTAWGAKESAWRSRGETENAECEGVISRAESPGEIENVEFQGEPEEEDSPGEIENAESRAESEAVVSRDEVVYGERSATGEDPATRLMKNIAALQVDYRFISELAKRDPGKPLSEKCLKKAAEIRHRLERMEKELEGERERETE